MAPCKFAPMRRTATYLFIICLLSGVAYGDSGQVERIANGAYLYHFRAELDGQTITRWGRLARLR